MEYVEAFNKDGFCVIDSLFSTSEINIDELREQAMANFEEIQEIVKNKHLSLGIGIKEGFDEIVQRHAGRYEVPYKMKHIFQFVAENQRLLEIVRGILGNDIVIANESLVVSDPGTIVILALNVSKVIFSLGSILAR